MPDLLASLLDYVRRQRLLAPGNRVGVAVSGGADSVALLRLLLELRTALGLVLFVVHFNHRIRGAEADADEAFVAGLARAHGLGFLLSSADTPDHARARHLPLEAAARELRYNYFRELLVSETLDRVATAHTLDDQAETVLFRFLRGSGTRGMSGIYPRLLLQRTESGRQQCIPESGQRGAAPCPAIVRPLLGIRRQDLRRYLEARGQCWREDTTNADPHFARNRIRTRLLPQLEREYNSSLVTVLAHEAEIARAEEEFWQAEATRALAQLASRVPASGHEANSAPNLAMDCAGVRSLPLALQRHTIRAAAETLSLQLEFEDVERVLALAAAAGREGKTLQLSCRCRVSRVDGQLVFQSGTDARKRRERADYDLPLPVPGMVSVPGLGAAIRASLVSAEAYNPSQLLNPALSPDLRVRNWRAGDRYQPAHTKTPHKLKVLLQEPQIPRAQKKFWPVIVSKGQIVWVPGFMPAEEARLRHAGTGLLLELTALV